MKSIKELEVLQDVMNSELGVESQVEALKDIINNILDEGAFRARVIRFKVQNYINSTDPYERLYGLSKIVSEGKGLSEVPTEETINEALEDVCAMISDAIARRYVQNKIEKEVEQFLMEKQEKYVDELRVNIMKKKKGPENAKTEKKLEELEELDERVPNKNIMSLLRPDSFDEVVGQERAVKSLLSKLASPYPQHIILYGPPGVGKTTAARIALETAKKLKSTPFDDRSKFIEVNGTTLRWDPREITNPLLGSVHDPIYQGSKRDLAEIGVPEPKPGLVTEAHGGILFIDEIGELDEILQNKLLKVLEDKRVEFSSSYYDPDDENTPKYIKYLFDKGAPADFVLIGATTREPGEINPALRSRCTEVYFEPLSSRDIEKIVLNAAKKLNVKLEEGLEKKIASYTIEGRRAVNILADAYGHAIYGLEGDVPEDLEITSKDLNEVVSIGRFTPYEILENLEEKEVGHVYGLGVSGFLGSTIEIEATAFKAKKKGAGKIRFNDTAGSMAKDSVFNAASVIKRLTDKDINDYDIHVNVIGGGKIDGPSAGAAITICIMSALLEKPIRQDLAITGEISLRGKIKPVGGIFEKIYGARRKGIKLVTVPKDNENEIPKGLEDIEVKAISSIEELMEIAFN
ncbi:TPA: Lon family ATP-dependent protease [Clostridium perfringens]|uniref:Lon family ATP-dependent protease n=1 Tax=Clostridium perfringens TaxID=1502 RepID=UPI0011596AEC|nr:Lon family ATP-dependent protease [Clostridium perfringens]EGT0695255.1 ATP-dependent protease, Lon family [Clostridium perfringens]EGT3604019.1 ATP-dependent protease, Lon family [Clostridium perfringens]EHA0994858.1 ATP-dependent protease, Lon family [Clostridium perfringens]EHA1185709.1 ATP-dependent protease, Lon family [Clostridium perfringens]EJT5914892.1 Lon family ATP-dependent protease [Clostridium perfringens]